VKLLIIIVLLYTPSLMAQEIEQDKILHLTVSAVGAAGLIKLGQTINQKHNITILNRIISSILMLGAGYSKELYDQIQPDNKFDNQDMQANLLGVITGNILQWEF